MAILRGKAFLVLLGVGLLAAAGSGYFLGVRRSRASGSGEAAGPAPAKTGETVGTESPAKKRLWTCAMHPQIKLPKPGKCPICSMDLIPLDTGGGDESPRTLSIGKNAAKLMEIETVPVERRFVTARVRMVGKIAYDETRVSSITAWVPGRLDRLFVDYTGVPVRKGDHMVTLYSPELLSAQEELLQAIKAAAELRNSDVRIIRETSQATIEAAREKLRLWGLTAAQIKAVEQRGKAEEEVTIYAPSGGIVIHKNAREGMYVTTGTRIYTIADLSHVWASLDAYESDLAWLRYGQPVQFSTEAYPGETFKGTISFLHPVLNEATRTVKVRVNVPNEDGRLKPGMFVRATASARVAAGGRVMDVSLAGKWICPMHPEIVKAGPGTCDVCGMPLVRAESLGYVGTAPGEADKPLVIPASAALLTGKRAVVYVKVPGRSKPTFEGREIVLGPRAGDTFLVRRGLKVGERVVLHGAFMLDAELQIQAKPSMMTPAGGGGGGMAGMNHGGKKMSAGKMKAAAPASPRFRQQFGAVVDGYLAIQAALARDDVAAAVQAAGRARTALAGVDMTLVQGETHMAWMTSAETLGRLLKALAEAGAIEPARVQFALLSEQIAGDIARFGGTKGKLFKAWCPMAFDNRGAAWIQRTETIENPYFGKAMLRCGEIKEVLQ